MVIGMKSPLQIDLLGRKLQQGISGGRILDSIKWLAKDVHVAGTSENEKLLDELGKMVRLLRH